MLESIAGNAGQGRELAKANQLAVGRTDPTVARAVAFVRASRDRDTRHTTYAEDLP
jgi:hypothetical protein